MLLYVYKELISMKKIIYFALLCAAVLTGCNEKEETGGKSFVPLEELPADYTLHDAKADGCVILENGDVTSGQNFWDSFVEQSKRDEDAYVRYCHYYTIEDPSRYAPEYYEEIKDEYPKMYVFDLNYDAASNTYTVRHFEEDREITESYKYLMRYEDTPESASATYISCTRYVLTNDNTVSWDDISYGMYSSQFGDYIEHTSVYYDYIYKDE